MDDYIQMRNGKGMKRSDKGRKDDDVGLGEVLWHPD
jgi:hypothetical protein